MWLIELIKVKSGISSKRFVSIVSLFVLIVIVGLNCFGIVIDSNLVNLFGGFVFGNNLLGLFDKKDVKDTKGGTDVN